MRHTKLILVLIILFYSCKQEKEFNNIICNIENSDGLELVYSIQGEDFKKRQIKKIKDGKVIFKSSKQTTEIGYIESAYNLDKHNNQRRFVKLLPEKNTINLNFIITRDSTEIDSAVYTPIYSFRNVEFKNKGINKKFRNYVDKKREILKGVYYSKKIDSLNQFVFPKVKSKLLNLYEREFKASTNELLQIQILSDMLNHWVFESNNDITEEESTKINLFFGQIKTNPDNNSFYKLQEIINRINKIEK